MNRGNKVAWVLGLAVLFASAGLVRAERTPTQRTSGMRMHGTRPDITVPYTTNGRSAFGVANGVSPKITLQPNTDDPKNPQSRPVYNLPYYGGVKVAGDKLQGVTPRPKR